MSLNESLSKYGSQFSAFIAALKKFEYDLKSFIHDVNFNDSVIGSSYLIYIAISCIILIIVGIIVYILIIMKSIITAPKKKTRINIETIEYASIYHLAVNSRFSYSYLWVILLGITFSSLCYYYYLSMSNKNPNKKDISTFLYIALFSTGIALILQICISVYTNIHINDVKNKVDILNTHIRGCIYKKGDFLKKLRKPATNTTENIDTITGCVAMLRKESDFSAMAKGFYTLTLYNYYNKFSSIPDMKEAYTIFDLIALTDQKLKVKPSSYMPSYGVYIDDIGDTILRKHIAYSKTVNEAMNKCDTWISVTNEKANRIYPDVAFNSFIQMLIFSFLINSLLVFCICYYGIYKGIPKTQQIYSVEK